MQAREAELLNVSYFHVVFTLPQELNKLALYTPKHLYSTLFATAWEVINGFGKNHKFLGAQIGMIAILHTWGQNLSLHPHLHCIVPGGGLTKNGKWKNAKGKGNPGCRKARYLFPVKAMSKVFRAKMVAALRKQPTQATGFYEQLFSKNWVVYCKQPFYGPAQVVEYLGRYTHKIAISNHRLKSLDKGVAFLMKDYRNGGMKTTMTLSDQEFIRRFAMHILPKGFVRIRHYGILSSCRKKEIIPVLQAQLGNVQTPQKQETKHRRCPSCKKGTLVTLLTFDSRGPPENWKPEMKQTKQLKTTPKKA